MSTKVNATEVRIMFDLYDSNGRQLRTYSARELAAVERLKTRGVVKYTSRKQRVELTADARATCMIFSK